MQEYLPKECDEKSAILHFQWSVLSPTDVFYCHFRTNFWYKTQLIITNFCSFVSLFILFVTKKLKSSYWSFYYFYLKNQSLFLWLKSKKNIQKSLEFGVGSDPEAAFTVKNCKAIPWKCLFREWWGRNYKEEIIYINNIYTKYIIYIIYIYNYK